MGNLVGVANPVTHRHVAIVLDIGAPYPNLWGCHYSGHTSGTLYFSSWVAMAPNTEAHTLQTWRQCAAAAVGFDGLQTNPCICMYIFIIYLLYLLYIYYIFIIYLLYNYYIFIIYFSIFIIYLLYIYYIFMIYLWYIYDIFILYLWYIYYIFIIYLLYIYFIFIIYLLYIYFIFIIYLL